MASWMANPVACTRSGVADFDLELPRAELPPGIQAREEDHALHEDGRPEIN